MLNKLCNFYKYIKSCFNFLIDYAKYETEQLVYSLLFIFIIFTGALFLFSTPVVTTYTVTQAINNKTTVYKNAQQVSYSGNFIQFWDGKWVILNVNGGQIKAVENQ